MTVAMPSITHLVVIESSGHANLLPNKMRKNFSRKILNRKIKDFKRQSPQDHNNKIDMFIHHLVVRKREINVAMHYRVTYPKCIIGNFSKSSNQLITFIILLLFAIGNVRWYFWFGSFTLTGIWHSQFMRLMCRSLNHHHSIVDNNNCICSCTYCLRSSTWYQCIVELMKL